MGFKNVPAFLKGGSLLTILTILGVVIGVGLGFGLREAKSDWTDREVMYIKFVGDMFLRTLQALILPLIVASLVSAIGSLDLSLSKKIGIRALVYYLATTAIAVVFGIVLVITIKPGTRAKMDEPLSDCASQNSSTVDTILDLVRNMFPPNLVGAAIQNTKTIVTDPGNGIPYDEWDFEITLAPGTNMMGLVIFSMVLGLTLGAMGTLGKPVLDFFTALSEATMKITSTVVWSSPLAICFLVAGQLVEQDDIGKVFSNLVWYFMTVLGGLLVHGLIILPLLYFVLTRKLPFVFMRNMFQALATAFGTASSSATLPVSMRCLEVDNKIDPRVSRFVLPIGATVNMNGTALYLPVGVIFIAQLCGRTLDIGELISVSLISIATSIGAAGIPQVGLVITITVLGSIGIPAKHMGYIMPIDWLLERFRTAVNVLGDAFGAAIIAEMSKDDLAKIPMAGVEPASAEPALNSGYSIPRPILASEDELKKDVEIGFRKDVLPNNNNHE